LQVTFKSPFILPSQLIGPAAIASKKVAQRSVLTVTSLSFRSSLTALRSLRLIDYGQGQQVFSFTPRLKLSFSDRICCRFVLANTEALHEKINLLANRVRHLEDGLAEAHSLTSHHPHPLLRDDLLQIKRPLERERLDVPPVEEKPDIGDSIDSLGSL
jgi:hypothetical protein